MHLYLLLIVRRSSANSVKVLLELHKELIKNFNFTPQQLVKISSYNGGSTNLKTVKKNFKALRDLHFTTEQIVKIAGHIGGAKNLDAVTQDFKTLSKLGLTHEQVTRIIQKNRTTKNLSFLASNESKMLKYKLPSSLLYQILWNKLAKTLLLQKLAKLPSSRFSPLIKLIENLENLYKFRKDKNNELNEEIDNWIKSVDVSTEQTATEKPSQYRASFFSNRGTTSESEISHDDSNEASTSESESEASEGSEYTF